MTAGDQVPVTPFDEVVGNAGAANPEQKVALLPGKPLNVVVGAGVTVTFKVAVVAHCDADGVNVYVPLVVLLIVAGLQVPVKPSIEVAGNAGGGVPAQIGAIGLNVGLVFCTTLTLMLTGVAETHCPAFGTKVLVLVPGVAVLIVAGFHVPVIPLVEAGKAGATAFWHNVAG